MRKDFYSGHCAGPPIHVSASMRRPFYEVGDPFCERRAPDDKLWGIDHVYKKLLKLRDGMHTATARAMAARRNEVIERFMEDLREEIPQNGLTA